MQWKRGATRMVLLTKRLAFKFPLVYSWDTFLSGLQANMQEAVFSATGWPELCPVIFAVPGGFLNVMPRLQTLEAPMSARRYRRMTRKRGYIVPAENKATSWGYLLGRVVAVDYGS